MAEIIVENDYSYYVERRIGNRRYVHCQLRLRNACFARGVKEDNTPIVLSVGHNHQIPFNQQPRIHFLDDLRRAASRSFLPSREIYNTVARGHPGQPLLTPFASVARILRNIRRRINLPVINTVGELTHTLYSQRYSHFRYYAHQQSIQFFNFATNAVIICAPWLISSLNAETMYVTSTSKSVVDINGVRLLTTVSVKYINHVFPVAFVVWSRRNDLICSNFSDTLRQLFQANVPRTIYTDFDLLPYLRFTFQGSRVIGTYDSYCRILYQRALELDVEPHLDHHDNFLRNCMNLILLPVDVANETLNNMIANLNAPELNDFAAYIRNEWVENENFLSFYDDFDPLNNVSVLMSNVINHRFKENLSPKEFIQQIIWFFYAAKDDSARLAVNRAAFITRFPSSTSYCLKKDLIKIQWTNLRNRRIDITVFLERMLAIHDSYYNDMMHNFTLLLDEQLIVNGLPVYQLRAGAAENQPNHHQLAVTCNICFNNRVNIICYPCLHVQMCSECAMHIRQATVPNGRLLCPFCNLQAVFHEARFRNELDINGFPLLTCELCNTHQANIVCNNCFALRMCNRCLETRREENEILGIICPTCEEEAELQQGFFS